MRAGREVRQPSQRASARAFPERPDQDVMTNPRADRVKMVARLAGRSARLRQGLFLAEGPQCAREALRAHLGLLKHQGPQWSPGAVVQSVYVSDRLSEHDDDLARLVDRAGQEGVPVRWATDEVLAAMADAVTGQGIIAVCHLPELPVEPGARGLLPDRLQLAAVLCRVQDPGNAGTIIRAADACGADAVLLTPGSVDVFNPKAVRSTAGSLFHLSVLPGVPADALGEGRTGDLQVLAADGTGELRLDEMPPSILRRPTVWLFGNEAQGLNEQERTVADHAAAVPLYGEAESLNVATAATVCLYASAMAQHAG